MSDINKATFQAPASRGRLRDSSHLASRGSVGAAKPKTQSELVADHSIAEPKPSLASKVAAKMNMQPKWKKEAMKSALIDCPHCGEQMTATYAIKALELAGAEPAEEVEALDEESDDGAVESEEAVKGVAKKIGNKMVAKEGAGHFHQQRHSVRTSGSQTADRATKPSNPVSRGGMAKSLFPVIEGNPQLVDYSYGFDEQVAKSYREGGAQMPASRNLRAEKERADLEAESAE